MTEKPDWLVHQERRRALAADYARSIGADTPEKVRLLFSDPASDLSGPFSGTAVLNQAEVEIVIDLLGLRGHREEGRCEAMEEIGLLFLVVG